MVVMATLVRTSQQELDAPGSGAHSGIVSVFVDELLETGVTSDLDLLNCAGWGVA